MRGLESNDDALAAQLSLQVFTNLGPIGGMCVHDNLYASPHGQWLAIQGNCEAGGYVLVVDTITGMFQSLAADLGHAQFLGWTGDDWAILRVDRGISYQIYRVNPLTLEAIRLPLPETTYHVAISPDGTRIIYSTTWGLGYGSQTYIANWNFENEELIINAPEYIIAFAQWSPDGEKLAYQRWRDTNIPFGIGELWVANQSGENAFMVADVDAGHGYSFAWSPDSTMLAFVRRENPTDIRADQAAAHLESNIYMYDLQTAAHLAVTRFGGVLVEAPVWSPDGEFLAFSANLSGVMDIWLYAVESGSLALAASDARHPAWVVEIDSESK